MTLEEFVSLPTRVALRVLFDCLDEETVRAIEEKEPPKLPRSPKYDRQIYRSGGFQWASETDLEGLRFWQKRALDSAAKGGQWAAKDAKQAAELGRWIEWRECFGEAPWSGERGDEHATAAPPSPKPQIHARLGGSRRAPQQEPDEQIDPDADIPF